MTKDEYNAFIAWLRNDPTRYGALVYRISRRAPVDIAVESVEEANVWFLTHERQREAMFPDYDRALPFFRHRCIWIAQDLNRARGRDPQRLGEIPISNQSLATDSPAVNREPDPARVAAERERSSIFQAVGGELLARHELLYRRFMNLEPFLEIAADYLAGASLFLAVRDHGATAEQGRQLIAALRDLIGDSGALDWLEAQLGVLSELNGDAPPEGLAAALAASGVAVGPDGSLRASEELLASSRRPQTVANSIRRREELAGLVAALGPWEGEALEDPEEAVCREVKRLSGNLREAQRQLLARLKTECQGRGLERILYFLD